MNAAIVRKYITQDFDDEEKKSYNSYNKGDTQSTLWIEKALLRREPLLVLELQCKSILTDGSICNRWINITETGICKCSLSHYCYDQVIDAIQYITK